MKRAIFLLFALFSALLCDTVKIENLRTELYSKEGKNTLKKIELSLEFEGENLMQNSQKLYDSTNTVVSSFFYEDLFTELGKLRFKQTLARYIEKKYKLKVKELYILRLKGIEKFDIEELKSFLEEYYKENEKSEDKKEVIEKEVEKNDTEQNLTVPDIGSMLSDTVNQELNVDDIDPTILQIPSLPQDTPLTPIQLKDKKDNNAS